MQSRTRLGRHSWISCAALTALLSAIGPVWAPTAAAQDALSAIDSCVRKLDPGVDIGYERIATRCPDLARRLDRAEWSAWLPRSWKQPDNDLSAGGLQELRVLVARELATPPIVRTPRVERLTAILANLGEGAHEPPGWWTRCKAWLRDVFGRPEQVDADSGFARLIAQVGFSEAVVETLSYAALALVVVLAGLIVVNELRSAGVFGAKRSRRAAQGVHRTPSRRDGLSWRDVERAPLYHRPRWLLELIAARLTEQDRLPPASGLTVRELAGAARLPDETDRPRLEQLALAAELVRFSDREISPDNIDAAVERGRELLERLDGRAPALQTGRARS